MKARHVISTLFITLLFSASNCGGGPKENSPEGVVLKHWEAIIRGDYDAAYDLVSKKQREMITKEQFIAVHKAELAKKRFNITGVEIEKTEKYGEYTLVSTKLKIRVPGSNMSLGANQKVIQEDGVWCFFLSDKYFEMIPAKGPEKRTAKPVRKTTSPALALEDPDPMIEKQLFLEAAKAGAEHELKEYLEKTGKDPDARDSKERTALMLAAIGGHTEVGRLLIKHGADINATDRNGQTALNHAKNNGQLDFAQALFDYTVSPEDYAAQKEIEIAQHPVEHIQQPEVETEQYSQAEIDEFFDYAKTGRRTSMARCLSKGMDPDIKDHDDRTALMIAAFEGHDAIVSLLLKKGADPEAKDVDGWTALVHAAHEGRTDMVSLLIDNGVDVNVKINSGQSVLALAKQDNYEEIVELLLTAGASD